MTMASLFGITLPQTNRYTLKRKIRSLKPDSKKLLYFLYSEFLLRANRNPWYKYCLQKADFTAIDGKGLHWAMWTSMTGSPIVDFYKLCLNLPTPIRSSIFLIAFVAQLVYTIGTGFFTLVLRYNFTKTTQNETILGRDFVYDLLSIAQQNNWKTLVLGGTKESDEVTKELIQKLFPSLDLITWNRSSNSLLMKDKTNSPIDYNTINSENVCQVFPDLYEAKQYIKQQNPQLLLVCLGGKSGKQEFFIENLKSDPTIQFILATGLGAAVDHLGGGANQPKPPLFFSNIGLEWLYRFVVTPSRRTRIIDSILTLWWWTSVELFIRLGTVRNTVVSIVRNKHLQTESYLLVDRPRVLPGDYGYSFVQGGIDKEEGIISAGVREIEEETSIKNSQLTPIIQPFRSSIEPHSISFVRYFVQGCAYHSSQHFVAVFDYEGDGVIKHNWENRGIQWVPKYNVETTLSIEKRKDWNLALIALQKNQTN